MARITAIVAGPAANVLAAFVILVTFYGLGVPKYVPTTAVQQIQVGSPAERMGLQPGDVVIAAQGKPVKDSAALRKVITTSPTVTLQVRRDGAVRTLGPARPRRSTARGCSGSCSTSAATARSTSAPGTR